MSRRSKVVLVVMAVAIMAIVVAEGALWRWMQPIRPGTSSELWACGTRVHFGSASPGLLYGSVAEDGDEYVYWIMGWHGQFLYRVSKAEAMRDYPKVLSILEKRAPSTSPADYSSVAFRRWQALANPAEQTPQSLMRLIQEANMERLRRDHPTVVPMVIADESEFHQRIARSHRYWLTCLFETAWLSGMMMLLTWPFWHAMRWWRTLLGWGLVPLMFYLPLWLGFAANTCRGWGPRGGIVYPWLLLFAGENGIEPWERQFLQRVPQILSPISQDCDGVLLSMGNFARGPLLMFYWMSAFVAAALLLHGLRWYASLQRQEARGFEVIVSEKV